MNTKNILATALTIVLLTSTLLLAIAPATIAQTSSANVALVDVLSTVGGTTNPGPGNYSYNQGQVINLVAIPDSGFKFEFWIASGSYTPGHTSSSSYPNQNPDFGTYPVLPQAIDSLVFTANPANITCGFGYEYAYQPVFSPISGVTPTPSPVPQTSPSTSDQQVIKILSTIGGTTTPGPGTYTQNNGTTITMTAMPSPGFAFHYWIASGSYTPGHLAQPQYIPDVTDQYPTVPGSIYYPTIDSLVFSINPVTITCGYGYTYSYQAVFTPINSSIPVIPTSTPLGIYPPTSVPPSSIPTTTTAPPVTTPTAVPTATPSPTPAPSGTDYTWIIIAVVVIIIIVIIAVVAVATRRKK